MNYRHLYHAGSFADVVKHIVVINLLEHFLKKETPFCFIDTHAGAGIYDLGAKEAQKTAEAETGILALQNGSQQSDPAWLKEYLQLIASFQESSSEQIQIYPGSPLLARQLLREQDKMIVNEKHEETWSELKELFKRDRQVSIHHRDAYELLPAILPVANFGRALVLIDPPFEQKQEDAAITDALKKTLKRFAHGTYAVWFPLTDKRPRLRLPRGLRSQFEKDKALQFEFTIEDLTDNSKGIIGCAMLIINPPWHFAEEIVTILRELWLRFSKNQEGFYEVKAPYSAN